ncbi:ABC transporter ATP-binding protein [Acidihalobacter ferrooxydans]|uniref:sn-glycerol-3-phosphate ABC transporter ATP-binding protein UgpC n=1 Tax=Acidihalobacter ferrooxydans TaxID=1765967 RepID=A0A1P8UJM2_9GAMM|nr:sn-glycerol-3-phosphate ABC transporter ATP-binding protein UgpC [Acidihalobacter ferrooxydans]APZ44023.1 sn-glycerol-3-phosphate ABC transporter ATP-binding protein UgpC [Acidihalobacter ferrooxydans]
MATLTLRSLAKRFGESVALTPTDLEVADGEFVVLVGPSGCGKTTLLRMVAGLESPSGGDILIGGQRVNALEPRARDIAMVFQNYALYPHMSVRKNLAYGLKLRRMDKAEIARRVAWAAELLGLNEYLDRKPRALSGGQRQRVAMGRAIVREPQVFLFDEPLSNLDAKLRAAVRVEIKRLHQRLATTTLYVTHDQVEAMTLAQRVVVMNRGRVEQIGHPSEVYARPATTFVAGFLGSPPMNLFEARLTAAGDAVEVSGLDAPLPLPAPVANGNRAVTLGIRPEAFVPDTAGTLPFALDLEEPLGAETLLHGQLGGQACTLRLSADTLPADATAVTRLSVVPEALHLFDAESGARLR